MKNKLINKVKKMFGFQNLPKIPFVKTNILYLQFDDGYLFLRELNDGSLRLSVGDELDSFEYHQDVDLFEFNNTDKLSTFLSLINLKPLN